MESCGCYKHMGMQIRCQKYHKMKGHKQSHRDQDLNFSVEGCTNARTAASSLQVCVVAAAETEGRKFP